MLVLRVELSEIRLAGGAPAAVEVEERSRPQRPSKKQRLNWE